MTTFRRSSLLRQLLLGVLALVAATWLATALVSYREARHEVDELLDAHLAQAAALVLAQVDESVEHAGSTDSQTGEGASHAPAVDRRQQGVAYQLWERGTTLRLHSANAPDARLSTQDQGFSSATVGGKSWRVFSAWDERRRYLVQVGERQDARREIVGAIAENLLWPLTIALPLLGILLWLAIHRMLRPLHRLSSEVGNRSPDNLAAVDPGAAPSEVAPLVASLNRLFERVADSLDNERRFTADAAHELRTPLAALRAQAQVARSARDDAERAHALDGVIAGCDRATHLVEQLLTLARLEPEATRQHDESCDLVAIARNAIADIAPVALARNVDVELDTGGPEGPPASPVAGDPQLLNVLLRNLLDNAVRYSPAGTIVRVGIEAGRANAGHPTLVVVDHGPGVPAADLPDLGRRFHRLDPGEGSGTGLGLSIVRRIAEIHGATIEFTPTEPGPGLSVRVRFGRSRTATVA